MLGMPRDHVKRFDSADLVTMAVSYSVRERSTDAR